jgi:cytoskeletal protein RodZ
MMNLIRKHPIVTSISVIGIVAVVAWLAFGFFAIQTHFLDDEVSEAAPVFDSTPASTPSAPPSPVSPNKTTTTTAPTAAPGTSPVEAASSPAVATPATTPAPATNDIVTELTGRFASDAHTTIGTASVLGNGTAQRFLRFEAFETDNGPDLDVYLVNSSADGVSDFVSLGDLKGNIGDQNYEIPADVDLTVYDRVVIWCVRFGVGFGHAELAAA